MEFWFCIVAGFMAFYFCMMIYKQGVKDGEEAVKKQRLESEAE